MNPQFAETSRLNSDVEAFTQWRTAIVREVDHYRQWLGETQLYTDSIGHKLTDILAQLHNDHITIAFVGECSRGKSELINALFYSRALGRRLLPSQAGRTTMCPTELFFDRDRTSYVRLLPIETRRESTALSVLKKQPERWKRIPLNLNSPEQVAAVLAEVARTQMVLPDEAEELGFDPAHLAPSLDEADKVTIPSWRHAIISLDHPLLRQGLTVVDTPGFNALGSEPELTMSLLPEAQAIVFLLASDIGVSASDLDCWNNYIRDFFKQHNNSAYVVVNKIDTLWDDPEGPTAVQRNIQTVLGMAARQLKIPPAAILPLSAKQGLKARMQENSQLLTYSQLPKLESLLSKGILARKQQLLQTRVIQDVISLVTQSRDSLIQRREMLVAQRLTVMNEVKDKKMSLSEMNEQAKAEQAMFHKKLILLKAGRADLQKKLPSVLQQANPELLEESINKARAEMSQGWTGKSAYQAIQSFFDNVRADMGRLADSLREYQKMAMSIYERYGADQKFAPTRTPIFEFNEYLQRLDRLQEQSMNARGAMLSVFAQKATVQKRFEETIVVEASILYHKTIDESRRWCESLLVPLVQHAEERRKALDEQVMQLRALASSGNE
ncbi:MAG TPA: dynamin family protein, partial [Pseudomonadales bacterium]|nr:dynamin family protein [Pseudomonadales bacterium]